MNNQRHTGRYVLLFVVLAGAAVLCWYLIHANSYRDRFLEGTFINGRNVGKMTAAEVEEEIRGDVEDYQLTLHFPGDVYRTLSMGEIGYSYAPDGEVEEILSAQNRFAWILPKFGKTVEYTVAEAHTFDEEKLRAALMELPELKEENQTDPTDAYMAVGADHRLEIVPENDGTRIDGEALLASAASAVEEGTKELDVSSLEVCSKAAVRSDDPQLLLQVSDLNSYLDEEIRYTLYDGSVTVLDNGTLSSWLSIDADNPSYQNYYYFDVDVVRQKCREFVAQLADQFDYVKDSFQFQSSWQGELTLPSENYGRVIDQEAESAALYATILGRQSADRTPIYSLERDMDATFGGTYLEVDIECQHMWYYEGGELYLESDVVTGKYTDPERRTPKGIFDIYTKERNRTLKGEVNPATGNPSYESFVNYWMPFYEGVGFHDATWRGSFGGDIYYYSGSHGCVNMPYSKAGQLYDMIEEGTPVIVY